MHGPHQPPRYINGRSKEVINRGGEIISPFEVEEAILPHPAVHKVVCFAVAHATLQETIGVFVVVKPGEPRPGLKELHAFCNKSLHSSKWPQVIIYATGEQPDIPRGPGTGKPLRQKLGERAGIPELTDDTKSMDRLFEAVAPPAGTSLSVPIACSRVVPQLERCAELCHSEGGGAVTDAVVVVRALAGGRARVLGFVAPACVDTVRRISTASTAPQQSCAL
jgi:hypothetical protein